MVVGLVLVVEEVPKRHAHQQLWRSTENNKRKCSHFYTDIIVGQILNLTNSSVVNSFDHVNRALTNPKQTFW